MPAETGKAIKRGIKNSITKMEMDISAFMEGDITPREREVASDAAHHMKLMEGVAQLIETNAKETTARLTRRIAGKETSHPAIGGPKGSR